LKKRKALGKEREKGQSPFESWEEEPEKSPSSRGRGNKQRPCPRNLGRWVDKNGLSPTCIAEKLRGVDGLNGDTPNPSTLSRS